jgi:predicted amino acid dehydrogenase
MGHTREETINFSGESVRLSHFSANKDIELLKNLISTYDGKCDAIALAGLPPSIPHKDGVFVHPEVHKIKNMSEITPIQDGQTLKDVYIPWALRRYILNAPSPFKGKKIGFYSGASNLAMIDVIQEMNNQVILADPYYYLKLPMNLNSKDQLEKFVKNTGFLFKRLPLKAGKVAEFKKEKKLPAHLKSFFESQVFVGNASNLELMDLAHLKGKSLILDYLPSHLKERLIKAGVTDVLACLGIKDKRGQFSYAVYEALLRAFNSTSSLEADDILSWIDTLDLKAEKVTISEKSEFDGIAKFAFIVHPLSAKQIFKYPALKWLEPYSGALEGVTENLMSLSRGFYWGKIQGIKSEKTGKEVEGLVYTVLETPRKMVKTHPDVMYRKLLRLANQSHMHGSLILGLGAYTKIIGDAGVTVNNQSPIPVTTGNSLSAASTIWAAELAIKKMNLVHKKSDVNQGSVMVVGATGSIGAAIAKVLSKSWKKVFLVAPRAHKLLEVKEEIYVISPKCEVQLSTTPDKFLSKCDLIITSTSAQGKKILDIMKVKPGAVICDVSRPFDISNEDTLKRPDVMVIASGEVYLPGENLKMRTDIGLEGDAVYACLAETALLAMEGRFEPFTLSKNIDYKKVIEIDRMAKDHGVRLASIMGHFGEISDQEFELCVEHAKEAKRIAHE